SDPTGLSTKDNNDSGGGSGAPGGSVAGPSPTIGFDADGLECIGAECSQPGLQIVAFMGPGGVMDFSDTTEPGVTNATAPARLQIAALQVGTEPGWFGNAVNEVVTRFSWDNIKQRLDSVVDPSLEYLADRSDYWRDHPDEYVEGLKDKAQKAAA